MPDKRLLLPILLAILALAGSLLLLNSARQDSSAELDNAILLPEPRPLAAFALTDHTGLPVTNDSLQGHWTLVFFGFTNCPDVCPLTLQHLAAARAGLHRQDHEPLPDILFISVDPDRDTQDALADYVANFGDGVRGARGELPELQRLTSDLGIFFAREADSDEAYQVSHSAAVILINPRGELRAVFSAPQQVPALVHDIPIVMAAQ